MAETGNSAGRPPGRRPPWIRVRAPDGETYRWLKHSMRSKHLHTVCEEAHCPNIAGCWGNRTATFLILGDVCTRNCRFCDVKTGRPAPLDPEEAQRVGLTDIALTQLEKLPRFVEARKWSLRDLYVGLGPYDEFLLLRTWTERAHPA